MSVRLPILVGAAALGSCSLVVLSGIAAPNAVARPAPSPEAHASAVSFASDILPLFESSCTVCHGKPGDDGEPRKEAYLDLTSYDGLMAGSEFGSVVEPGDADDSVLMDMIVTGDMPSQDDGPMDPLTEEQIEMIRQWINEGAQNN